MEEFFQIFINLAYLVPGLGVMLSTGLCFLILRKLTPSPWQLNLTRALLCTSIIILFSWVLLHFISEFKGPYKLLFYAGMIVLCLSFLRSRSSGAQKILFPVYLVLYVIFDWQTTHVSNTMVLKGKWYPTGVRIALQFPGGCVEVNSSDAIKYLGVKKDSTIDLTLDVLHENGSFAGYHIKEINGKVFDYDDVIAGYCKIEGKFGFPLYSFSLRGLTFDRTRPHVNSEWIPTKR